jgi:hypothetical protein
MCLEVMSKLARNHDDCITNFGMLGLDNAEGRMGTVVIFFRAHCLVWLTSLDCSCGDG